MKRWGQSNGFEMMKKYYRLIFRVVYVFVLNVSHLVAFIRVSVSTGLPCFGPLYVCMSRSLANCHNFDWVSLFWSSVICMYVQKLMVTILDLLTGFL